MDAILAELNSLKELQAVEKAQLLELGWVIIRPTKNASMGWRDIRYRYLLGEFLVHPEDKGKL